MQVAVVAVRMVERARHVVVDMVAVRDALVPAGGPMVLAALDGRARAGPRAVHLEAVLVEVPGVRRVQMPVMKVVGVVAMTHGFVPAFGPMLMGVALMFIVFATGHAWPPRIWSRAATRGSIVG